MYEQNLVKVIEPVKKTTISRLNKSKKWKNILKKGFVGKGSWYVPVYHGGYHIFSKTVRLPQFAGGIQ